MTNEEIITRLNGMKDYYNDRREPYYVGFDYVDNEAIDMAIKALEQQPCKDWKFYYNHGYAQAKRNLLCDDCISRAKALEMLGDEPENWTDTEREIQEVNDYKWFKSILEELPPVTPQQPSVTDFSDKCKECGKILNQDFIKKDILEKIKAELIKYLADYDFGTGYQNDVAMIIDKYIERDEKRTCANCLLDGTDACSRGAGRAIDDRVCEDYLEGVRASDI